MRRIRQAALEKETAGFWNVLVLKEVDFHVIIIFAKYISIYNKTETFNLAAFFTNKNLF